MSLFLKGLGDADREAPQVPLLKLSLEFNALLAENIGHLMTLNFTGTWQRLTRSKQNLFPREYKGSCSATDLIAGQS